MSSKLWRNVALAGVAAAGAAVWAVAPRTFNDKRRNFVPSIPKVWYAHRGLHDAGSGLVGYTDIADYGGDNSVSAQPIPLSDPSPKTMIMCRLPVAWLSRPATAVRI